MVNNLDGEMNLAATSEELPPSNGESLQNDAGFSGTRAKAWMYNSNQENKLVSANELTSLSALISYVAHHSGEKEFGVERRLSDRFHIPNITCLAAADYDSAIRYLVDTMGPI